MNKQGARWAVIVASLAVTASPHAAEIEFDFHPNKKVSASPEVSLPHHIAAPHAQTNERDFGGFDIFTRPPSDTTDIRPNKDTGPVISEGPLTTRPAASTRPIDHHFFWYLGVELTSGYLYDSVAYWPATTDQEMPPFLMTDSNEFQYNFILEGSYVTDYWPDQGQFSWPVTLHMAAFDNNTLTAEVSGAQALAFLDSTNGHFRLTSQAKTIEDSFISISLSSYLIQSADIYPNLINPLLSIRTGDAPEQISVPELRLILTGNRQSDIAGQFNNFVSSENVDDILTIIGQFSSASTGRK